MNKTFSRNDVFDIKAFDSEKLKKLAEYYCDVVNLSFKFGIFRECEEIACVRPMLKKVSYLDVSSFLSKAMEYACLQQLLEHFNIFACLYKFQSARRKFHSVETALCRV